MRASVPRVVIVTGSSRGLGREIALRFGSAGDAVVVNYLNRGQEAVAVAREIARNGGEAVTYRADVGNAVAVEAMVEEAAKRWGTVDVLVNNAGMTRDSVLLRMPEPAWDDVLTVNLAGPFHCIRAVSKIMVERRKGHIVNVSSIVAMQGREGQANYSASKAGLIGLTKACARELGCSDIKVNAVLPGFLGTDMGVGISDAVREKIIRENVLARVSDPKEVAEFVYHLTLMNNVSGQAFNLDSRII